MTGRAHRLQRSSAIDTGSPGSAATPARAAGLRLVMSESMILVLIGVVVGLGVALAAGRLVGTLLFGLSPTDATTMGVAVAVMILVSAAAGYSRPACSTGRSDRRAAIRVDRKQPRIADCGRGGTDVERSASRPANASAVQ